MKLKSPAATALSEPGIVFHVTAAGRQEPTVKTGPADGGLLPKVDPGPEFPATADRKVIPGIHAFPSCPSAHQTDPAVADVPAHSRRRRLRRELSK